MSQVSPFSCRAASCSIVVEADARRFQSCGSRNHCSSPQAIANSAPTPHKDIKTFIDGCPARAAAIGAIRPSFSPCDLMDMALLFDQCVSTASLLVMILVTPGRVFFSQVVTEPPEVMGFQFRPARCTEFAFNGPPLAPRTGRRHDSGHRHGRPEDQHKGDDDAQEYSQPGHEGSFSSGGMPAGKGMAFSIALSTIN